MEKIDARQWRSVNCNARNWTQAAIDCYMLGCNCSKCPTGQLVKNCRMKYSVIQLVATHGISKKIPEKRIDEIILPD